MCGADLTNNDLIDELNHLKMLGMLVVDEAYDLAREADITLYATLSKQDAAMHLMRFGIQKKFKLTARRPAVNFQSQTDAQCVDASRWSAMSS